LIKIYVIISAIGFTSKIYKYIRNVTDFEVPAYEKNI